MQVGDSKQRVVAIDTDPGVDDALAFMLALRSPEIRVALITTVAGNVPVGVGTENAGRLLALIDPPQWPRLVKGAARPLARKLTTATYMHGDDGLGGATRLRLGARTRYPVPRALPVGSGAPKQLVALARKHGPELDVVALGPLTNIARAIEQDPDAMGSIGRLVIMGGAIRVPGNITAVAEFNIYVDPEAAAMVMDSGLPITLVPLDATHQVALTTAHLTKAPNTRLTRAVKSFTRRIRQSRKSLFMHDPLAVAVAIKPELVSTERLSVEVETTGARTSGMTVADLRGRASKAASIEVAASARTSEATVADLREQGFGAGLIDVATSVDAEAVLALFEQRVLSRDPVARKTLGKVVVVGSANVDLTVSVPRLPAPGETALGPALAQAFGGKGANQAIAARRAGSEVEFVAKLGRDSYGLDYVRFLKDEDIDLSGLTHDDATPSGVGLIMVDAKGENQIAVASGANAKLLTSDLSALPALLEAAQVLVVQLESPMQTVKAALRCAKKAQVTTLLNSAPARPLSRAVLCMLDVLVANETEAEMLSGMRVRTTNQAKQAARRLREKGARNVVVTLGERGAVCANAEGSVFHIEAVSVKAVDTTAAGDTFVGYLAAALAAGKPLREAVATAGRGAAVAVTRRGAVPSIPYGREVER